MAGACVVSDSDDEVAEPRELCSEASAHLADCLGTELTESSSCDVEEAEAILEESCEGLRLMLTDKKSDFFDDYLARIGCRLGLYYLCEAPVCDAVADEPVHELGDEIPEDASACAQAALAYEGCGACEYYRCREEQAQCGEGGYLLNFAERYCNRFRLLTEPNVSAEGRAWMRRVRRCLVTSLDAVERGNDCQSIEESGLGTHPSCYVDTGFCELPVSDWLSVINTIEPGDLDFEEMFVTGNACLAEWLGSH